MVVGHFVNPNRNRIQVGPKLHPPIPQWSRNRALLGWSNRSAMPTFEAVISIISMHC